MAKTKYDFAQDTQFGRLIYKDVPSYSPDFLGTTGDAVLVRQFIKNYLPFYKTSVTSSTGSSIRVKILETNWSARYSVQNSVVKVGLNSTWLQDILEPLFEGKGFDGMQDLEYSKPLPKLINTSDQNQEVSYGHNYIFVDPKDLVYQGFVDLDHKTGKGYPYEIVEGGVNIIKTGYVPIDAIILKYIKGELTAPNEGDLVTLEKGPTVPVSNVILTMAQQEMVDFLALNGIVSLQYIKENFKTSRLYGRAELIKELISMDLVVADSQSPPLYQLTQLGYDSVSEVGTIPYLTKEQLKVLYALSLNEGQIAIGVKNLAVITDYPEDLVINVVNALEVFKLIDVFNNSNQVQKRTYAISKLGQEYLDKKNSQDEKANIATPTNPNNGNLAEAKETFVDSLSSAADGGIYKNAVKEFIDNNADAFKIMGKEDPDLYTAILSGLSFVLGQQTIKDANLEPFKSLENQQQLEDDVILNDLISDDDLGDLDLDDLDLQEIDLSGLQEDIEINEDELGDLSDFDELKDFVDSELMPSTKLKPVLLEILKILYITNSKLTADNIKNDLSMQEIFLNHKAVFNRLIELRDLQLVEEINSASNGILWQITPEGEKYISNLAKSSGKASATDIENISEYLKKSSGKQISSSPTDIMLKEIADTLGYDFYLVLTLLNENNGLLSSGTVTELLQQKFNKKPKWDELEVLTMLRGLTSLGLSYTDVSGNEYFEITEKGENVVKYLSLREDIGLYPESKPTQQTVASRPSPTDIMLKERQKKAEKLGDELEYDYYLILKTLNDDTRLLTAGTITTILQRQFNKKPKWDVTEIRLKLRVLTSLGMAYMDVQNSIEYFEIREFGQDVVKYLIEQENKGLYPKSKPTQQTVASRPSPTQSATMNYVGTIAMGNDGNYWEVKENKNGVKRWVKSKL